MREKKNNSKFYEQRNDEENRTQLKKIKDLREQIDVFRYFSTRAILYFCIGQNGILSFFTEVYQERIDNRFKISYSMRFTFLFATRVSLYFTLEKYACLIAIRFFFFSFEARTHA